MGEKKKVAYHMHDGECWTQEENVHRKYKKNIITVENKQGVDKRIIGSVAQKHQRNSGLFVQTKNALEVFEERPPHLYHRTPLTLVWFN